MGIDSRHLAQLIAIVECGSYRKAAEHLHIAQPALTVSIKKLERELGTEVFLRSPTGVVLSAAGEALLAHARRALGVIEDGRRAALEAAQGQHGSLRLGFVGSAAYALLPRLLPIFARAHPDVSVELTEGSTVELVKQLLHASIDICIVREPLEIDPQLNLRCVDRDRFVIALPAEHPLANEDLVSLARLQSDRFIVFSHRYVPAFAAAATQLCSRAGFLPRVAQEASRVQTIVSLVACGLGVALVPSAAANFENRNVRFVRLLETQDDAALLLSVAALRDHHNPVVKRFLDLLPT